MVILRRFVTEFGGGGGGGGAVVLVVVKLMMVGLVMDAPTGGGHVTEIRRRRAHDGHDRARIGDGDDLAGLCRDEHPHMQHPFDACFSAHVTLGQ